MMNRKEFEQYLLDNIKDYLPDAFQDADVYMNEVVKNNDQHMTAIVIQRPDESVVPQIYIESLWEEYQDGADIEDVLGEIADTRMANDTPFQSKDITPGITNYDMARERLTIRLCDTQENKERLAALVHTERSDYSATYHVNLMEGAAGTASVAVTPDLMHTWGVTVEQIHQDALTADLNRGAVFCSLENMMEELMFGGEIKNLLDGAEMEPLVSMPMYCLTNAEKVNGSGLLMQDDILEKIGELMGENYYVLPSSCHEVLIVPESVHVDLHELSEMVSSINQQEVAQQERLSDKVQYYDRETGVLANALDHEAKIEREQAEEIVAKGPNKDRTATKEKTVQKEKEPKKRSIKDRLGEKKAESAARKTEKAATKTVTRKKEDVLE